MSKQLVFRQKYIDILRENVANENLAPYSLDKFPYSLNFDNGEDTTLESRFEHDDTLLQRLLDAPPSERAIILYKAFENMTPAEAAQLNLWVYLEHVDLFPFVKKITKEAKTVGAILDNWFGSNYKHALASLWWQVYMTIDLTAADEENRYKYTRYFLSDKHSDLVLLLSQSSLFKCREFNKGVLKFLMDNDGTLNLIPVGRFIIPYYNRKGGLVQLASWTWEDFYNELQSMKPMLQQLKSKEDSI